MTAAVMPVRAVTFLGLLAVALACAGLPLHVLDSLAGRAAAFCANRWCKNAIRCG